MDTLDDSEWDIVIGSTGLSESLLALSLSRSNKKILHLDPNPYYGGTEAALSLDEAEEWARRFAGDGHAFSHARLVRPEVNGSSSLASSRAYALALAPQILHARSNLISALVSSQTHSQLEFQAVGSWFILGNSDESGSGSLTKVPNGREDVFSDTSMSLRAKRSLMKFLRFVGTFEENPEEWQDQADMPFPDVLEQRFGLPQATQEPLLALALSSTPARQTTFGQALPAIARHLRSIGIFGPGFPAVIPKWGGLAEVSQVACRACAVGGGVYVLNKPWSMEGNKLDGLCHLTLQGGEKIRSRHVVTTDSQPAASSKAASRVAHTISIVSAPLISLFPLTSEGGVIPAGAVIAVPGQDPNLAPVYIMAHSSEAGECPSTQCILYASVQLSSTDAKANAAYDRLAATISDLLGAIGGDEVTPSILWRLQYTRSASLPNNDSENVAQNVLYMPSLTGSLALEDEVLDNVKTVWSNIIGAEVDDNSFLHFEPREESLDEE